jgi:hypothetical protein
MPNFSYIGLGIDGKEERGTIEAVSAEEARERLRKKGLMVDQVKYVPPAPQQPPVYPEQNRRVAAANKGASPVSFTKPAQQHPSVGAAQATPAKPAPKATPSSAAAEEEERYVPLVDTFRLYAGWLLAWYSIVYLLGSYQFTKGLPFEIPFLEGLFLSPLVLKFAFGTFAFLMLSGIHRAMGRGLWKGLFLTVVWVALVTLFSLNV